MSENTDICMFVGFMVTEKGLLCQELTFLNILNLSTFSTFSTFSITMFGANAEFMFE